MKGSKDLVKLIKSFLLFVPVAIVLYILLLLMWGLYAPGSLQPNLKFNRGGYGHTFSRLQEVKNQKNIDVLILGSSHAYRGFDTRIFKASGRIAFNLGSSAQTPLQSEMLLKRYWQNLKPEIVLLEVFPYTFSLDGIESSLDLIRNDCSDMYSLSMALRVGSIRALNSFLFGIFANYFKRYRDFSEPVRINSNLYVEGGFVQKDNTANTSKVLLSGNFETNKKQIVAIERIRKFVDEKKAKLYLVYAPVTSAQYDEFKNSYVNSSLISSKAIYTDFNKRLSLNDSMHFYDAHHLNQAGVEVFNKNLLGWLDSLEMQ